MEASPKQYLITKIPLLRGSVLSIGCGRGADELYLARTGLDVLATDVDLEKLETVFKSYAVFILLLPKSSYCFPVYYPSI